MKNNLSSLILICIIVAMLPQLYSCRNSGDRKTVVLENEQYFSSVKPYLNDGYDVVMVPKGISMLPTIGDNTDLVTLHAGSDVNVRDIVLVQMKSGQYVMHRIIKHDGDKITLKGDNNKTVEHVATANVIAKVVDHQKNGAKALETMVADSSSTYRATPNLRFDKYGEGRVVADTLRHVVYMQRVVSLNEAAQMLWDKFQGRDFCIDDLAKALVDVYDIDAGTAKRDCTALVSSWLQCSMVQKVK